MKARKKLFGLTFLLFIVLGLISFSYLTKPFFYQLHFSPKPVRVANLPPPDYKIVFLGDSMTEYLGNFDELQAYLKKYYPQKTFLLLNYGFGSTSIISVLDRLEKDSTHSGRIFEAINNIDFKLIIIESFGHNPLSEFPLEVGLQKQTAALDKIVGTISQKHSRESIVFLTTIAPNKKYYAKGQVELSPEKRAQWADERNSYIENHIQYAKSHNIPLINVYGKSLKNGDGNLDFISDQDYIHPSAAGIYLISEEIAGFIKNSSQFTQ